MKTKKDYIIIPFVIYPFDLMVSIQNESDFIGTLKKILPEDVHDEINIVLPKGRGRSAMFSSGQSVIHLSSFDEGTIAHESFHIVQYLMARLETPLVIDTEEPYAYLLEYIVNEIHKWLGK